MHENQFVSFRLGDALYGIDILYVREIVRIADYTPVRRAPDAVRGLMNLRGQLVALLDPGLLLGLGPREVTPGSRCIVIKRGDDLWQVADPEIENGYMAEDSVGILVDGISDVATEGEDGLEPVPAHVGEPGSRYCEGVLKLDGKLLQVLSLGRLLSQTNEDLTRRTTVPAGACSGA